MILEYCWECRILHFLMKYPTHQHREDESHEATAENSEGHGVGHEQREGGGQRTEQVRDAAEDKVSHVVVILLGPVLVGDPTREQLADRLRDAWGEEEFTRASETWFCLLVFFLLFCTALLWNASRFHLPLAVRTWPHRAEMPGSCRNAFLGCCKIHAFFFFPLPRCLLLPSACGCTKVVCKNSIRGCALSRKLWNALQ